MSETEFKDFAKGRNTTKEITPGNAVLYNRVSTKEQEENQSLDVQLDSCNSYAERYHLNIVETFGGVFESAKTDKERKEFNKMLTFIRRNKKLNIQYVIVYRTNRFSRTGSTTILEELESMGITVLSATSNYNPKTVAGKFQQRMETAVAAYENEEKSQLTKELGRAALLKGRWIGKAPRGYIQITTKAKQTITINEEGKFIKMAFHWKADEKLTNEEILQRLGKLGFFISKQKLSEMLKNPFYCGLMTHNFLNGEIQKGNHPAIISEEIFLKANEVLSSKYTGGYEQQLQKEWAPLLGTLKCPCCGYNVSASISTKMKKKYNREVYYYVCSRKGCRCNNQVIYVHEAFSNYLSNTTVKDLDKKAFETQLIKVFEGMNKEKKSETQHMKTEISKLTTQLKQMEANWAIETHPKKKDILWDQIEEADKKIRAIEKELSNTENSILNLSNFLKYAIDLAYKPLEMWEKIELGDKQRFQNLLFPKGFYFDKKNKHIEPLAINQFFFVNPELSMDYEHKKRELSPKNRRKSPCVLGAGVLICNLIKFNNI
jgi:DNA invertase Pin-like site-specific DNA recombinase